MRPLLLVCMAFGFCLVSCDQTPTGEMNVDVTVPENLEKGLYAHFTTSQGDFTCVLFEERAPKTVANFVGLAKGEKAFRDPRSGEQVKRPYYNGLTFHRVIKDFMLQGGCPQGDGRGGPGYEFEDEFHKTLRHDQAGRLSMANAGPGTNGSQFFVTTVPTPHLDNRHSIFGQVVNGLDIVTKIENVRTGRNDKPVEPVVMQAVTIVRID